MKEWSIKSKDEETNLRVITWEPEGEVRAILQIAHGMIEHIARYQGLAEFLGKHGILVVGNDHLGHGHSVTGKEKLGYFAKKGKSSLVVADMHSVTKAVKKQYPDVPYFLLGHSMGSFLARRYCMTYGEELAGAIFVGTGAQPAPVLGLAKTLCGLEKLLHGEEYRSKLIKIAAFGTYNKRIPGAKTQSDWLSQDEEVVRKYRADELCGFDFTVNGYSVLFDCIGYIQKRENVERIPKTLSIYLMAGEEDPVGAYGKGPKKVYADYCKAGICDVALTLYPKDRHEILNELDKEQVYQDLLAFLNKHIGKEDV